MVKLAEVVDTSAPYLALLIDKDPKVRSKAIARVITLSPTIPELLLTVAELATDLPRDTVENELTFSDLMHILRAVMQVNDWDMFWHTAYSLRITSKQSLVSWVWSRLTQVTT